MNGKYDSLDLSPSCHDYSDEDEARSYDVATGSGTQREGVAGGREGKAGADRHQWPIQVSPVSGQGGKRGSGNEEEGAKENVDWRQGKFSTAFNCFLCLEGTTISC